jgi:hypothetical protein
MARTGTTLLNMKAYHHQELHRKHKKIHFCNGSSNTDMLWYTQVPTTVEENVSEGLETGTVKPDYWPLLIRSHHRTIWSFKVNHIHYQITYNVKDTYDFMVSWCLHDMCIKSRIKFLFYICGGKQNLELRTPLSWDLTPHQWEMESQCLRTTHSPEMLHLISPLMPHSIPQERTLSYITAKSSKLAGFGVLYTSASYSSAKQLYHINLLAPEFGI